MSIDREPQDHKDHKLRRDILKFAMLGLTGAAVPVLGRVFIDALGKSPVAGASSAPTTGATSTGTATAAATGAAARTPESTATPEATATTSSTTKPTETPEPTPNLSPTSVPTPTQSALMEVTPTAKQEQEYRYQIHSPVPEEEKNQLTFMVDNHSPDKTAAFIYSPSMENSSAIDILAVWDGDLQPGRLSFSGKLVPSISIKNGNGIVAFYIFDGDIEGNPMLPRKAKAGEKIGTLKKALPPFPVDPTYQSWLELIFQQPPLSPDGKIVGLPAILDAREFKIK